MVIYNIAGADYSILKCIRSSRWHDCQEQIHCHIRERDKIQQLKRKYLCHL